MFVKRRNLSIYLIISLFLTVAFPLFGNTNILESGKWFITRLEENQGVQEASTRIYIPVTQITYLEPFEREDSSLWLKQEFRIPDQWLGQSLVLTADYPLAGAELYINGESLGTVEQGRPLFIPLKNNILKAKRFNTLLIKLEKGGGFWGGIYLYKEPVGYFQKWISPLLFQFLPLALCGIAFLVMVFSLVQIIRKKILHRSLSLALYSLLFFCFTALKFKELWMEYIPFSFSLPLYLQDYKLSLFIPVFLSFMIFFISLKRGRIFFLITSFSAGIGIFFLVLQERSWLRRLPWADQIPVIPLETGALYFGLFCSLLLLIAFIADSVQQKRIRVSYFAALLVCTALWVPDFSSFFRLGTVPLSFFIYLCGVLPFALIFLKQRESREESSNGKRAAEISDTESSDTESSDTDTYVAHTEPEAEAEAEAEADKAPVVESTPPVLPVSTGKSHLQRSLLGNLAEESFAEPFFKGLLWDLGVCRRSKSEFSSHFFDYVGDKAKRLEAGCFLNLGRSDENSALLALSLKGKVKELLQSGNTLTETVREMDSYISQAYESKNSSIPLISGIFFRFTTGYLELTSVSGLPVLYRNARSGKVTVIRMPSNGNTLGRGAGADKGIKSLKVSASAGDQFLLLHPSVLKQTTLSSLSALFRKLNFRDIISIVQSIAVRLDPENRAELFYMIIQARDPLNG